MTEDIKALIAALRGCASANMPTDYCDDTMRRAADALERLTQPGQIEPSGKAVAGALIAYWAHHDDKKIDIEDVKSMREALRTAYAVDAPRFAASAQAQLTADLAALVERWQERAASLAESNWRGAHHLKVCASELAAILAQKGDPNA